VTLPFVAVTVVTLPFVAVTSGEVKF
jgi:hypothetical protein